MIINHNMNAMNAHRMMSGNTSAAGKSMEKLSSGLRINRAGDDAAGLAISEKMRGQIRGLDQASRNSQDGISLLQTAEGALNETHSMIQRVRELAVQANNDTNNGDDRDAIQKEITSLKDEIDRVASKTEFNTKNLLDGSLGVKVDATTANATNLKAAGVTVEVSGVATGKTITFATTTTQITATVDGVSQTLGGYTTTVSAGSTLNFDKLGIKMDFSADAAAATVVGTKTLATTGSTATFQIGANTQTTLDISISNMKTDGIGTGSGATTVTYLKGVNVNDASITFDDNLKVIDKALKDVSTQRAQLGAWQNRLEHTINNLNTSSENLQAAESRVRDVDMAKEMMNFSKNNILSQAAQAMLAQANQQPQGVLQLLR